MFKELKWNNVGLNIDGNYLSHLKFAKAIVFISSNLNDIQKMLTELNDASQKIGLKMNYRKTTILSNDQKAVTVRNQDNEMLDHYVYLGCTIKLKKNKRRTAPA